MKVNPVGKRLSEVERAYIAGFLDADGAIMATIERHKEKKFGFRIRVVLKATQANPKILHWLQNKCHCGLVRKNRTTYDWLLRKQSEIKELLTILKPYFKIKNQQTTKALRLLSGTINSPKELMVAARLADTLARLNVRSKNRRINHATMIKDKRSRND
ncbi:hypothetical protein A3B21_00065 [Candidatus Uhrbacteria bacterium RIFCSPLOWO2_01_FULL_47_24]|uniref:Homing endonuclease LAGLIDADG domain-containing protein n=1 Tax=Candidatus Uhrbacteria bacterium RIFCSPLOWO2_01_FULL_47_24 TaxID=1802401 RepID=A0A1F7UU22_9BACT|nr:MAG: hypothetical protein A2753_00355 [Candidatus Uhrbacteria bacterium RIFCSPHIGHO2_01_FULL_47_11]OGL69260.1 MAG: hypothetical protein A3D58_03120 [Candidatus Uhrbacteria bacterium RIFCSPHIGHO2_02_FULL_46_47]OGL76268.1 MAG: hypothetical protein A3F52_02425 [Candidatus Uhrbacteria bacterium RIFCSPHIGHO2_12_FULL_47_11]OGL81756.1 MAG: hypothetical protein A3B21_00065 [Candidatus Uhrbacteria bacterium RIFCSPLOWO2_01_FULL_47_24]OGL85390.1 MAG: hypothetical protein A3J03_04900 [Candidatus Uhrbact